jgi:hypothetical protein
MVGLFAIGAVAGILLGLRFKVLVLVPAIGIATVAIVMIGGELPVMIVTEVGTVALLQLGYFVGCCAAATLGASPLNGR